MFGSSKERLEEAEGRAAAARTTHGTPCTLTTSNRGLNGCKALQAANMQTVSLLELSYACKRTAEPEDAVHGVFDLGNELQIMTTLMRHLLKLSRAGSSAENNKIWTPTPDASSCVQA